MGKNAHPTDQFRRQQRALEIKKNKARREQTRDVAAAKKDPSLIKAKLDKLEQKEKDGKNPKYIEEKKHRLQELYTASLKRAKTEEKDAPAEEDDSEKPAASQAAPGVPTQSLPPQASIYYHPTLNPFGTPPPGAPQMFHPGYTMNAQLPPGLAPPPGLPVRMPPPQTMRPPGLPVPHAHAPPHPHPHPHAHLMHQPVASHPHAAPFHPGVPPPAAAAAAVHNPHLPHPTPTPTPTPAPASAEAAPVAVPIAEPLSEEAKKELEDMMGSLEQLPPKPEELGEHTAPAPAAAVPTAPPVPRPAAPPQAPPPVHQPIPPPHASVSAAAYPPQHAYGAPPFYPAGGAQRGMVRPGQAPGAPPQAMRAKPVAAIDPFAASNRPAAAAPPPSAPAPVATPPPAPEKPVSVAISADVTAMIPAALRRAPPKAVAKPKAVPRPVAAVAASSAAPAPAAPKPAAAKPAPTTDTAYDEFMANMKALGAL